MEKKRSSSLQQAFSKRFGQYKRNGTAEDAHELLTSMASRGSCRDFLNEPVPDSVLNMLCAIALASPTKSDLQQRDIILLRAPDIRQRLVELVSGQSWVASAPMIAVFCGNNRRQRLLHEDKSIPFANDHLDALFNAIGDAAIALGAFVTAAEASGLGCCPISAVRNQAAAVSDLLELPDHVFPFAGLAIGYPRCPPTISMRLPLDVTCHVDRYSEHGLTDTIRAYDTHRAKEQPYSTQRLVPEFGEAEPYTWSDDKVRQYSQPERETFGEYIRAKGFNLD